MTAQRLSPVPWVNIAPALPPVVSGIGDYAWRLADSWSQHQDFAVDFLVADPHWSASEATSGWVVQTVARSAQALSDALAKRSTGIIFLHYAGHGYARRGCPTWLIQGLKAWKAGRSDRRLVTFFHEIYATGPLLSSALVTSAYQRHLAIQLIHLSDVCLSSRQAYGQQIQRLSQRKHLQVTCLPVFSTIGEPAEVLSWSKRQPDLVVFGGAGQRCQVYQRSAHLLQALCQRWGIRQIYDLGPPLAKPMACWQSLPIQPLGILPPQEIRQILNRCQWGFFDYPLAYLAKSTIFAAYCAHGLMPIGRYYCPAATDGLRVGQQFWAMKHPQDWPDLATAATIATQALTWYQGHNLATQSQQLQNILLTQATLNFPSP